MLICVSYILGLVNIDVAGLLSQLQNILPSAALDVLGGYLGYISMRQSPGLFLAGLAGCWFSAAAAFRTITRVMIDMYDAISQSMVRGLLVSILLPFALLLTVDLSVMVVVTGQRTLDAIIRRFPFWRGVAGVWAWTRYLLLFCLFSLFILAVLNLAAPPGHAPDAPAGQQPGLLPGPGGGLGGLFLVHRPLLPLLGGLRLPGVPDHPPAVAVSVRPDPLHRHRLYQRLVQTLAASGGRKRAFVTLVTVWPLCYNISLLVCLWSAPICTAPAVPSQRSQGRVCLPGGYCLCVSKLFKRPSPA